MGDCKKSNNFPSVTIRCEVHALGKLKLPWPSTFCPRSVYILFYVILGVSVVATRWRLSKGGNTASPSVFSVIEMGSLLQLYTFTYIGLRKIINMKGCRLSFHSSSESQRPMALSIDNEKCHKPES